MLRVHRRIRQTSCLKKGIIIWYRGERTFSLKGQIANIFGFVGHSVSVVNIQLCPGRATIAVDNIQTNGMAVPVKCYKNRSGLHLAYGP